MTDEQTNPERERVRKAASQIVDGIYFDLPAEIYHAVERLSTSHCQAIDVSPADFWTDSWLNPANDETELDEDSTAAQILGKAYHCARLEPELFEAAYIRQIERADFPAEGACWTGTDIGEALAAFGMPKSKAGESVYEKALRLEAEGYTKGVIYPLEEAKWEAQRGNRIAIKGKYFDEIVIDMHRIRRNPDIAKRLSGGAAEVSIFWTDERGIKWKTRLDYLRPDGWCDLKTFANPQRKKLDQVLREAMMYGRLYIQAAVQWEAVARIRAGKLEIQSPHNPGHDELVAALAGKPNLPMDFVFIQKGGVPNQIAKEFPFYHVPPNAETWDAGATPEQIAAAHEAMTTRTALFLIGLRAIAEAVYQFTLYSQVYKPGDEWFPINATQAYDDADFPPAWLERN